MNKNIEIKARISDFLLVEKKAASLAGQQPILILQEDVFYNVPKGRLKLRKFTSELGELIYYERDNSLLPKESHYQLSRTKEASTLHETLAGALGIRGVVRKERHLFLVGQTRIHLDKVDNLGDFVELEVVMEPAQTMEDGVGIAYRLMEALGISESDLIDCAYIDLLEKQ
jgi:predicted adenylyl cyclase CyaB